MPDAAGFPLFGVRHVARLSFLTVDREYRIGGGSWTRRDVVRHPGSVVVVPWDGTHVVFIRQFRSPVNRAVLEVPAGKLDVPGEDPTTAAGRELIEETGLAAGRLTLLHSALTSPGFTDEISHIYLAEDLVGVGRDPKGVEETTAELVMMTVDDVAAAMESGRIVDATTLIGVLALLRRLGR